MGFPLPDLIVESIIRDGFQDVRRDPEIIEDVFSDLTKPYASRKYGEAELEKIKKMVMNREVSIVHAFHAVDAKVPCISIQMAEDREEIEAGSGAMMNNQAKLQDLPFTDPADIAALTIVSAIDPTTYDDKTGLVTVPDSVNLAAVHVNLLFVDAAGAEHVILGGINNTPGEKQFLIGSGRVVNLGANAEIKTSIDFERYKGKQNAEHTTVILGIHTKEALLTKYLYQLIKYFLKSREKDICSRGIILSTYSGSDFTPNMDYVSDQVYTRFLHFHGKLEPTWRSDKVQLVDNVSVNVKVPRDKFGNIILGLLDQTVQVNGDDDAED